MLAPGGVPSRKEFDVCVRVGTIDSVVAPNADALRTLARRIEAEYGSRCAR